MCQILKKLINNTYIKNVDYMELLSAAEGKDII